MPKVPYAPYPTVEPTTQGQPSVRVDASGAAFGENVAQAVQQFGLGLERDADKIFHRAVALQDIQNETIARQADAKASKEMGMLHADFQTKLGLNAGPEALEKYTKDLTEVYQRNRGDLPNDDARRRYDANALSVLNRSIFNGAGHSGQQVKSAYVQGAEAQIKSIASNVYESSLVTPKGTPIDLDQSVAQARAAANAKADILGMTPEARKEYVDQTTSSILSHMIVGTARNRPAEAGEMFDKYKGMLHGDDVLRVDNTVQDRSRVVQSKIEVDKILDPAWKGGPTQKLPIEAELREKVDAMSDKLHPDDPLFKDAARHYFQARFGDLVKERRNLEFNNKQTIESALLGNFTNGNLPLTVDDLTANPEIAAAWGQLNPSAQRHYRDVLATQARRGDRVSPSVSLPNYNTYLGMARNSPNEFLEADILGDKGLSNGDKRALVQLKQKIYRNEEKFAPLNRAMQIMRPDLDAAGYDRKTDSKSYDQFTGVMNDWMTNYIRDNAKFPKTEEILKAGRELLRTHEERKFFGLFRGRSDPMFLEKPPEEVINEFKEKLKLADPTAPEPTDEQVMRALAGEKLKRLMTKPSAGGDE